MTGRREFGPQFPMIVNAAVKDDVEAAAGTRHRLVATGWVDNRKATHAKRHRTTANLAVVIRTAVPHGGAHARHGQTPLFVRIA
jgi:hypothetical protein